ncbi:NAD-dependent glucose-6-phosphate dehydrogenase [uncultured archaeon]|nr:NAD-dependent glucose-6-phosphate dehydrogenase [uncultured archaeon]
MKKALITGINGFAGSHLADYIIDNRLAKVYGTYRGKSTDFSNIRQIRDKISMVKCDVTDYFAVEKALREVKPDYVFHLAAQSYVPDSWKSPHETLESNTLGSLNLFEAICRAVDPEIKVQVASTSEVYGKVYENELPIKETNQLRPLSPYGVSKAAMDLLAYQYFQSYGLKVVRTRAFNHAGPRRGEVFVDSNWAKQIAEIEMGLKEPVVLVGSLDSKRDFTDVRDVARAYWLAIEKGEPGEVYNICSGKTHTMKSILDRLLSMTDKKISIKEDPSRLRPSDVKVLLGDSTKFSQRTGWKPEIPLEKTMADLMEYWREKIKRNC